MLGFRLMKKVDDKEKYLPFLRHHSRPLFAIISSKGGSGMRGVVYVDVLFCVNFSIDLILLVLSGLLLSLPRRPLRISLSACVGGVFSVLSLWLSPSLFGGYVLSFLIALLLCAIAYAPLPPRSFAKLTIAFFFASLLLGGAVSLLYSALAAFFETGDLSAGSPLVSAHKAELFVLYVFASALVFFIAGRFFVRRGSGGSVMLTIEEGGRSVTLSALVDSGNLLTDPLSARPVILVRRRELIGLLPSAVFSLLETGAMGSELPFSVQRKLRILPVEGVGGKRTLVGYLPDCILSHPKDAPQKGRAVDAVIAICDADMRDFDGHAAILPQRLSF